MKIKAFCSRMNNHGTNPRIIVFKHSILTSEQPTVIIYEGNPYGIPNKIGKLPVNSFTVIDMGVVVIHTA